MDINKIYIDLLCEIIRGIARDPNRKILAIDTGIKPITWSQWKQAPIGKKVISCAYAGTNWITALIEKSTGDKPLYNELNSTLIKSNKHQISIDNFVELMADNIITATRNIDLTDIDTVAIALGFSQNNKITTYGLEAQFNVKYPGKTWNILGFNENITPENQPYLGKILLEKLHKNNLGNFKYIFFQNDTNAVANFINESTIDNTIGAGFIFGTGDNASIGRFNLELGRLDLIEADEIYNGLINEKIITVNTRKLEQWMGGDYIIKRLAMEMLLKGENEIFNTIMANQDDTILSVIASGKYKNPILSKAQSSAQRILTEVGQLIGVVMVAVATAGGYDSQIPAVLLVEGSVFWKGFGVKETAKDIMNLLIPHNHLNIIEASGIIGIGQAAIVFSTLH
jgi:hypothetical protein